MLITLSYDSYFKDETLKKPSKSEAQIAIQPAAFSAFRSVRFLFFRCNSRQALPQRCRPRNDQISTESQCLVWDARRLGTRTLSLTCAWKFSFSSFSPHRRLFWSQRSSFSNEEKGFHMLSLGSLILIVFVFPVSVTACRGLAISNSCVTQNLKTSVFRWVSSTSPGALCRISSSVAGLIPGERTSATPRSVLQISDRHLGRYPIHSGRSYRSKRPEFRFAVAVHSHSGPRPYNQPEKGPNLGRVARATQTGLNK